MLVIIYSTFGLVSYIFFIAIQFKGKFVKFSKGAKYFEDLPQINFRKIPVKIGTLNQFNCHSKKLTKA